MRSPISSLKTLIYHESYHDNCHDYLKTTFIKKYAVEEYQELILNIKKYIPIVHICNPTPLDFYPETIVCDQHAVIFTHYQDIKPVLATYALNACVGLVIYEPKIKIGSIAHIDGLPGYSKKSAIRDNNSVNLDPIKTNMEIILSNLTEMVTRSDLSNKLNLHFYLIGGIFDLSEIMIHDILERILSYKGSNYNFIFKGRNLLGPENQSRNICLDTRTGNITYFDYLDNVDAYENKLDIVDLSTITLDKKDSGKNVKIPQNIIKAPRRSEALLDVTYQSKTKLKSDTPK